MARIPVLAVGIAAGAVAVIAAPILARHMRPVAKAAFLAAFATMEELRLRMAEMAETAEDLMAEARAERGGADKPVTPEHNRPSGA